ncbi:cation diffusion facilitator family transporter [Bradyrhizobium ontarionense]|uniref:Cation diffusion facilitator family transporter n=1 Tax=Bradyrhizobium ontarionense TaxID=2898149 RepID=A0ABY3RD34_9BRAD|nr:cation diffusion facilitator family transporter [Bradyrhizobium sp. A19]UFZ04860.1 cation diffusion facilitator family transporter [Bradyrhizobium sp. A19]
MHSQSLKLAAGSLVVGAVVLGLKYFAYWLTGSVALYSDALESIVNVVTAGVALLAVRIAAKPADANHPFGHHKVEYFSAVIEGVMIIVAALLIVHEAYGNFFNPRLLSAPIEGLAVNGLASLLNAFWCWLLITRGKRLRSPALVADGRHLLTDVVSSGGVVIGLLFAVMLKLPILDPALALLVAINILWSGWQVLKESTGGLMDEAVSDETLARIRRIISEHADGALEAHDVRTRHAGKMTFIEFHLVVPGQMSVQQAHEICDRIEAALRGDDEHSWITIHIEPESKAKHSGVVVL